VCHERLFPFYRTLLCAGELKICERKGGNKWPNVAENVSINIDSEMNFRRKTLIADYGRMAHEAEQVGNCKI
jgi:hypothetical protein